MSNLLDTLLEKEKTFLSVDASVLYDERTNSYVCIKREDLESEQALRLNGDSEQAVYDRLKKEGLIVSYTPEQQQTIKEDMKWLLQEHYQEELAEQKSIGWDDLTNVYLYETDGRLAVEVPGVGLGVEQVMGGVGQQWRLINTMTADPAYRYYDVNASKELTYTPKYTQEIDRVEASRDTPENVRGVPDDGFDDLLAELDGVPNEVLTDIFRSIKEFDISGQDLARLEEVYELELDVYDINAVAKGELLEDGRYRLETSHRIENQTRGVSSGEAFAIEFKFSNESFEFEVIDNRKETYHNQIPLKQFSNIRDRQKYQISVSDLNEFQQEQLYNLCVFPIVEVENALVMLDEHELILERNKTHDMTQWLTNYNGLTPQEQQFIVKQIDYDNHLSLGESLVDTSPGFAVASTEISEALGDLVSELEAIHVRTEGLYYPLETELSMLPETIVKDVHELLATDHYKQRAAAFKTIEETLSPEQSFSRHYGIEHDRAFSSEDLLNLYERSGDLSTNEVYAAINRHQSETIVEWSYSGERTKAEIDEYQETKTESLSEKVTSGHATYQINADTELLIVPNTDGMGHDGFLLSTSGEVTSLKTASTEETIDKLIDLDAYAVPSLPSLKSLLASPNPLVNQEQTRQSNLSKTIGSADLGREYR